MNRKLYFSTYDGAGTGYNFIIKYKLLWTGRYADKHLFPPQNL